VADESIDAGADHDVPLYVTALPDPSTSTQKDELAQETAFRKLPGLIADGADHDVPLKVST